MEAMDAFRVPDDVYDEIGGKLFDGQRPELGSMVLYVGDYTPFFAGAVRAYCEAYGWDVPTEIAFEHLHKVRRRFIGSDFEESSRDRHFLEDAPMPEDVEYVIGQPPVMPWTGYTMQKKRAEDWGHRYDVLNAGREVNVSLLYLERIAEILHPDGRAVLFTNENLRNQPVFRALQDSAAGLDLESVTTVEQTNDTTVEEGISRYPMHDEVRGWLDGENRLLPGWEEYRLYVFSHDPPSGSRISLDDVRSEVITQPYPVAVGDVMTPDPQDYRHDDRITAAYMDLKQYDYDAALVRGNGGTAEGYISRDRISILDDGEVAEFERAFTDGVMVEADAPIYRALDKLSAERYCFVFDGEECTGVVTRADLNAMPVRVHLYSKLAQLEVGLCEAIRAHDEDWNDHTDEYIGYKGKRGVVPDMLACAQFSVLIDIAESMGIADDAFPTSEFDDTDAGAIIGVRNDVAHYHPLVHTMSNFTADDGYRTAYDLLAAYEYVEDAIEALDSGSGGVGA